MGKTPLVLYWRSDHCVVTQIKTIAIDGYNAIQLGFNDKSEKRASNAMIGHFKKANTTPKKS